MPAQNEPAGPQRDEVDRQSSNFVRDLAEASPPKSVETIKAAAAARDIAVALKERQRNERIRIRAYYLWVENGMPEGKHDVFWLQAEAEPGSDEAESC